MAAMCFVLSDGYDFMFVLILLTLKHDRDQL